MGDLATKLRKEEGKGRGREGKGGEKRKGEDHCLAYECILMPSSGPLKCTYIHDMATQFFRTHQLPEENLHTCPVLDQQTQPHSLRSLPTPLCFKIRFYPLQLFYGIHYPRMFVRLIHSLSLTKIGKYFVVTLFRCAVFQFCRFVFFLNY